MTHRSTPPVRHDPRLPYFHALMDAVPHAQDTVDTFAQHFWYYDDILQEAVPEPVRRTLKALYDPRRGNGSCRWCSMICQHMSVTRNSGGPRNA